jgi:hypothetical protein
MTYVSTTGCNLLTLKEFSKPQLWGVNGHHDHVFCVSDAITEYLKYLQCPMASACFFRNCIVVVNRLDFKSIYD